MIKVIKMIKIVYQEKKKILLKMIEVMSKAVKK